MTPFRRFAWGWFPARRSGRAMMPAIILAFDSSLLALMLVCVTLVSGREATATVPSKFSNSRVAFVSAPTDVAFLPDGRPIVTTQRGQLVLINGTTASVMLDLSPSTCSDTERGLLGVAVDPNFTSNHFIYLYYTYNRFANDCPHNTSTSPVNRVSRFATTDDGSSVSAGSEFVLIDNIPSPNGNHNGGDLGFGKDRLLYVSVGDGGCTLNSPGSACNGANTNTNARSRNTLLGKILRITSTGAIPSGNPYQGAGTTRCNTGSAAAGTVCQEIYAWGLRNPFRLAFDPNASGTRLFINDVGQDAWEEIDVGKVGADYGWNCREGLHPNDEASTGCSGGYTNPTFNYGHGSCGSITGGAFVPAGAWPSSYGGAYLYADYNCGTIFSLSGRTSITFASGLGGLTTLAFGPYKGSQALYYTTHANGGELRRIAYTTTPTAKLTASPKNGPLPLKVAFDGSGSKPSSGNTLAYAWDFGDGSPISKTSTSKTSHT